MKKIIFAAMIITLFLGCDNWKNEALDTIDTIDKATKKATKIIKSQAKKGSKYIEKKIKQ